MVKPVTTSLKEGQEAIRELAPTPDPDLFNGGEHVKNPAHLSTQE
jgi:hypothetical protein